MIGQIVGNYKIEELLGEGGMGAVYRGVDLMLEREVAVKVLRPELAGQPALVERFRTEAVALAKLYHPNIATLHSFFRQANGFFMVLEFVRGETLDGLLKRRGALGCAEALPLFCQALEGISYAHSFGIIHRDIKPGNVMIDASGRVKVMDFGIARVLGASRLTRTGFMVGTLEYMSPEQILGEETDARSDIYSLGVLLYEMLSGRCPFSAASEFKLMKAHAEEPPPPPREFAPDIPAAVEAVILRALAKAPAERFASAEEFRAAFVAAADARHTPPAPPEETAPEETATKETAVKETASKETTLAAVPSPETATPGLAYAAAPVAANAEAAVATSRRRLTGRHYAGLAVSAVALAAVTYGLSGVVGRGDPAATRPAAVKTEAEPAPVNSPTPTQDAAAAPTASPTPESTEDSAEQVQAAAATATPAEPQANVKKPARRKPTPPPTPARNEEGPASKYAYKTRAPVRQTREAGPPASSPSNTRPNSFWEKVKRATGNRP